MREEMGSTVPARFVGAVEDPAEVFWELWDLAGTLFTAGVGGAMVWFEIGLATANCVWGCPKSK